MPLWRCCLGLFLVSGFWTVGASRSNAQSSDAPAILTGAVDDPSGARIPRASVHIHNDKLDRDTSTNGTGIFTVTLPDGTYTVTVRATGFRELSRDTILHPGDHQNLNFRLAINAAAEIISVDPWAGSTDKQAALNLSGNQLEILSDDPETLRQQLIVMAGGGIGLAAPQIYVDGFSNGQVPPKSAIRAVHINSDPYSTVYDRPGFGRVEIETQAGGNRLHGMFDVGGTGNALNSNNPYTETQPPYYQLLFRGNVSGPIGKNTSYFLAGNTSDLQNNAIVNTVTVSEAVPNPQREDDYSFRLDHRFTAANQMNGRYEIRRVHQTNAGVGLLVLPEQGYTSNALTQTLQLDDSQIFNPKIVNDARFQYIRTRSMQDPNSTGADDHRRRSVFRRRFANADAARQSGSIRTAGESVRRSRESLHPHWLAVSSLPRQQQLARRIQRPVHLSGCCHLSGRDTFAVQPDGQGESSASVSTGRPGSLRGGQLEDLTQLHAGLRSSLRDAVCDSGS